MFKENDVKIEKVKRPILKIGTRKIRFVDHVPFVSIQTFPLVAGFK
jgi:hypothetical protein